MDKISDKKSDYIKNYNDLERYECSLRSMRDAFLITLLPLIQGKDSKEIFKFSGMYLDVMDCSLTERVFKEFEFKLRSVYKKRNWKSVPKKERVNIANTFISNFISDRVKKIKFHLDRGKIILNSNSNVLKVYEVRSLITNNLSTIN